MNAATSTEVLLSNEIQAKISILHHEEIDHWIKKRGEDFRKIFQEKISDFSPKQIEKLAFEIKSVVTQQASLDDHPDLKVLVESIDKELYGPQH